MPTYKLILRFGDSVLRGTSIEIIAGRQKVGILDACYVVFITTNSIFGELIISS